MNYVVGVKDRVSFLDFDVSVTQLLYSSVVKGHCSYVMVIILSSWGM